MKFLDGNIETGANLVHHDFSDTGTEGPLPPTQGNMSRPKAISVRVV